MVTRVGLNEWIAESQPDPETGKHVAFCQVGGRGGGGEFYDPGTQLGAHDIPLKIRVVRLP